MFRCHRRIARQGFDDRGATMNLRSSKYGIASTKTRCWKCAKQTAVFGLLLPAGHEVFQPSEFEDEPDIWEWVQAESETVYYDLQAVCPAVLKRLSDVSSGRYRMDKYRNASTETLMNHCEYCGVRQSEKGLNFPSDHGAPDSYAFAYITVSESKPITVQYVAEPFEALGGGWIIYAGVVVSGDLCTPSGS